jgi:RNA polymerase sigma-70 factor, ECF subfamily
MQTDLIEEEKSDIELVELTLQNQDNFLYITKRYKDKLFRYIMRLTNIDPEDAEDILQEVFLKVYINLNDFDPDMKFSSWIYRITHNQVISHFRHTKSRPQGNAVSIEDSGVLNLSADLDLNKEVDIGFLRENIFKVLDTMDVKYREVLVLKFFEEKDYKEISDIIKRPMGTVASFISKAKQEFKNELSKQNIKL